MAVVAQSDATLQRVFAEFDVDCSGAIQVAEFSAVADRLGLALPEDEIQALMAEYDADGSGEIDFEEFIEAANQATSTFANIITELKQTYLDDQALAAGAEDVIWYSDEMLVARERLKKSKVVIDAIRAAWDAVLSSCAHLGDEAEFFDEYLNKYEYGTMMRKVYLAIKEQEEDGDFEAEEFTDVMDQDWATDAHGKAHMDYDDFFQCMFQLADLNTSSVDGTDYARWLRDLVFHITTQVRDEGKPSKFTDDSTLIGRILQHGEAGGDVDGQLASRWEAWADAFALDPTEGLPRQRKKRSSNSKFRAGGQKVVSDVREKRETAGRPAKLGGAAQLAAAAAAAAAKASKEKARKAAEEKAATSERLQLQKRQLVRRRRRQKPRRSLLTRRSKRRGRVFRLGARTRSRAKARWRARPHPQPPRRRRSQPRKKLPSPNS